MIPLPAVTLAIIHDPKRLSEALSFLHSRATTGLPRAVSPLSLQTDWWSVDRILGPLACRGGQKAMCVGCGLDFGRSSRRRAPSSSWIFEFADRVRRREAQTGAQMRSRVVT